MKIIGTVAIVFIAKDISIDDLSVQLALAFSVPVKEEQEEHEETPNEIDDDKDQPPAPQTGKGGKPKRVLTRRESLQ